MGDLPEFDRPPLELHAKNIRREVHQRDFLIVNGFVLRTFPVDFDKSVVDLIGGVQQLIPLCTPPARRGGLAHGTGFRL